MECKKLRKTHAPLVSTKSFFFWGGGGGIFYNTFPEKLTHFPVFGSDKIFYEIITIEGMHKVKEDSRSTCFNEKPFFFFCVWKMTCFEENILWYTDSFSCVW